MRCAARSGTAQHGFAARAFHGHPIGMVHAEALAADAYPPWSRYGIGPCAPFQYGRRSMMAPPHGIGPDGPYLVPAFDRTAVRPLRKDMDIKEFDVPLHASFMQQAFDDGHDIRLLRCSDMLQAHDDDPGGDTGILHIHLVLLGYPCRHLRPYGSAQGAHTQGHDGVHGHCSGVGLCGGQEGPHEQARQDHHAHGERCSSGPSHPVVPSFCFMPSVTGRCIEGRPIPPGPY